MLGRRTDPHRPAESLLVKKALGEAPHEGGVRFTKPGIEYGVFHDWIAAGCPADRPAARRSPAST